MTHLTLETQQAFDSVAADYDGPLGNNALIQRMRVQVWRWITRTFPRGSRLLDLGGGTGLDAAYLAGQGYRVLATDWSPNMVEKIRTRARQMGLEQQITARHVGIHELEKLSGEKVDGVYSNFGPLNCVPDLAPTAQNLAKLLSPGSKMIFTVIGRHCPWETFFYTLRRDPARARIRQAEGLVPVSLNQNTVWTRYYTPQEFFAPFAEFFTLTHYRALSLFLPPPYLVHLYERFRPLFAPLGLLDDALGGLPLLREAGDHFLIVLTRNERSAP